MNSMVTLTPADIRAVEFRRSFYGYNPEDVDDFLERLYRDYSELYAENRELREKLAELRQQLKIYHNMEEDIKSAVITAQRAADELIRSAELRAEAVYSDKIRQLERKLRELEDAYAYLIRQVKILRRLRDELISDLQSSLQSFLKNLNRLRENDERFLHYQELLLNLESNSKSINSERDLMHVEEKTLPPNHNLQIGRISCKGSDIELLSFRSSLASSANP